MGYEFTVERTPTYLHVKGSGDHTADNLKQFLRDAYRAAIENDRDCLLMELNFAGPSLNLGEHLRRGLEAQQRRITPQLHRLRGHECRSLS